MRVEERLFFERRHWGARPKNTLHAPHHRPTTPTTGRPDDRRHNKISPVSLKFLRLATMSDDDNYGSEEEYEYQYSDEDDDNSSSQPMAIDSDVDDASDGSRKRKAGTAGSNGGGGAADSRRRSGSNVHNAMMELIDGGGGELPVCVRSLILGVGGCVAVAGCKPPRSPGRAGLLPPWISVAIHERAWSTVPGRSRTSVAVPVLG